MLIGIDLGTTYSCVAFIGEDGGPVVIPNSEGELTTPSVVCFTGEEAWVGEDANRRKDTMPHQVFEFVKRKMGQPVEIPSHLYELGDPEAPRAAPYEVGGFKYGAAGISALVLRKLKQDAIRYFKQQGRLPDDIDEKHLDVEAVITVPSYFGDRERMNTRLAGFAAGLDVVNVINEPTAAALAYGMSLNDDQVIFVFDLGGGTCDVTILEMRAGQAQVLTSTGNNQLGGRNWDQLIQEYLWEEFHRQTGNYIPDNKGFQVQKKALEAKMALSEHDETTVRLHVPTGTLETTLYRSAPETFDAFSMDGGDENAFYFEERAQSLLQRCRVLCSAALGDATYRTPGGRERPMEWGDIDQVVLAGGSTRMPMVVDLVESVTGRQVAAQGDHFDHETAIAKGAAIYGRFGERVKDVAAHSIGLEVVKNGRSAIEHIIEKDSPLPVEKERTYKAGPNARLTVYEGESTDPTDHDQPRGVLELGNKAGEVTVRFHEDADGFLHVMASYPPDVTEKMDIKNELYAYDQRALPLRERVQNVFINA